MNACPYCGDATNHNGAFCYRIYAVEYDSSGRIVRVELSPSKHDHHHYPPQYDSPRRRDDLSDLTRIRG